METLVKVLIGVAAAGAVAATTYVVVKKVEEKKQNDISEESQEQEPKKETIIDKAKFAAQKKVIKIFSWILLNKQKLEVAALLLSLLGGVIKVVGAVKDIGTGLKIRDTLDEFKDAWNENVENCSYNFQEIYDKLDVLEGKGV